MPAPYTKKQDSTVTKTWWTITDGYGCVIVHVETESMANVVMALLLDHIADDICDYPIGVPLGSANDEV